MPPPPTQPPGQWTGVAQTLPQASTAQPSAVPCAVPKMGMGMPGPMSFGTPMLHMTQGPVPPLQGFMGIGAQSSPSELITVMWEGKPFQMPAGLAQQMHLQPAPSQM